MNPHRLKIKLFGPQAKAIGAPMVCVNVAADTVSCAALRQALANQHPMLAASLAISRFAVNCAFVPEDALVCESAEIALIGAVSGG